MQTVSSNNGQGLPESPRADRKISPTVAEGYCLSLNVLFSVKSLFQSDRFPRDVRGTPGQQERLDDARTIANKMRRQRTTEAKGFWEGYFNRGLGL